MGFHINRTGLIGAALILCASAGAQSRVSLPEASARRGPDRAPKMAGQSLVVRGTVAAPATGFPDYVHLPIQDDTGAGLMLEASAEQFEKLQPGFEVEVAGMLADRAGLPVLQVSAIRKTGQREPPEPQKMTVADLNKTENLGRFVEVESMVQWVGQNAGGDLLAIGTGNQNVLVFLPFTGRKRIPVLSRYKPGDRIRVVGVSAQYCPFVPYDRGFEIIISGTLAITLLSSGWVISPVWFAWALAALLASLAIWWWRERKLARQRSALRGITLVAEDVIAAGSPAGIARRLEAVPVEVFGSSDVELYLYSESGESLDRIITEKKRTPFSVPRKAPIGTLRALPALCFRNKAALAITNLPDSPLVASEEVGIPRGAILAPMLTQGEIVGVIAVWYHRRRPDLSADFQAAFQHLANQIAASFMLQDRQAMKEQLLRSEKMAAAGQLISGVARDLRVPLDKILRVSHALLDHSGSTVQSEFREISTEAGRCCQLVDHLVTFSHMEHREPGPLDLAALLRRIIEARRGEHRRKGIEVESQIPSTTIEVLADETQIERALTTAMLQAEQAAASAPDRKLRIRMHRLGNRVQFAFESSGATGDVSSATDYFGLPVAQAIVQSRGGDLRNASLNGGGSRLEFELPLHTPGAIPADDQPRPDGPARVMTVLIVEPDLTSQRRLLALLAARGHRAIPASAPDEAAELVQRMQFGILFCSVRVSGLTWVELYHRVRRRVGLFTLLTDGFDPDSVKLFSSGEGQVLAKPVEESELDAVLGVAELRWTVSRR